MGRKENLSHAMIGTDSSTEKAVPAGQWRRPLPVLKARAKRELRLKTGGGTLNVALGIQVMDNESAVTDVATYILGYVSASASEGFGYPSAWVDLGAATAGKQFYRLVWFVKFNAGDSGLHTVIAAAEVEWEEGI